MIVEFKITGMHCGSCAALIKEELGELPGVKSAEVVFDGGHATIDFDEAALGSPAIVRTIEQLGYHATPVE